MTAANVEAWFDTEGWQLPADDLAAELARRGADDEDLVRLVDHAADLRLDTTPIPVRSPITWRDLVRDSNLDRTAKLCAFVLSTYMDKTGHCYPSKATIAAGASLGSGRRAVDNAIDTLEAESFLIVTRSKGRSSFRYQATVPANVARAARLVDAPTSHETTPNVARAASNVARRATESAESAESDGAPSGVAPKRADAHPLDTCAGCHTEQPIVDLDRWLCTTCTQTRKAEVA